MKSASVVAASDDLATENPKVGGMFADGVSGKLELDEMNEKGTKTLHQLLAGRDVFGEFHPSLGPFMQIFAAGKAIEHESSLGPVWDAGYGNGFLFRLVGDHGTDPNIKGFVYEDARFSADKKSIEVRIRPRMGSKATCSGCQQRSAGYDQLEERRFEFIPIWGFLVFFLYRMRRVNCRSCGVLVEAVPWGSGKHQLTKAYMLFLAHWARKLSWKEVAESFQTSWEKVCQSVEYIVEWGLRHRTLGPIFAIGIDEIQYAKGHKYLTLVYPIDDLTRLLWVGADRTVKTFEQFFAMIGPELSAQIEFVCSDMGKPYLRVIREKCSQALHILDRFHIVAKMNTALDEVRAEEARKLMAAGHQPVLKKTRWCILKRKANLNSDQRFRLRDLLRHNLKTVRAYLLKEDSHQFWEYDSPVWAGKFLDEWCPQTIGSRIEPMKKIAKMLRSHRELILNYFRAKKLLSSGVVEGLNNKGKVTMRKSYGFRTFRITELALYHSLGKLPEPELAHRFY